MRILRPLVAEGLLHEIGEESYALTNRGSAFGLPAYDDSITFAYVNYVVHAVNKKIDLLKLTTLIIIRIEFMPIVLSNPTFFRNNGYQEPRMHEGLNTPLANYFQRPNYGFFDYLNDHSAVQSVFMSSMKAQVRSTHLASSVYPYSQKLSSQQKSDEAAIAIVDIGGSRGELLQEIRNTHPGIKGRMIVQDRQETFDSMTTQPDEIELMAHDLLKEQPLKGNICRNPTQMIIIELTNFRGSDVSYEAGSSRLE